jgi:acetoacetyl-CoA reductase
MTRVDWDAVIETNLTSLFNVTGRSSTTWPSAAGAHHQHQLGERREGQFGQTSYSAAKAGMHSFTMALARKVASKGVTVSTVSPGYRDRPGQEDPPGAR